MRLFSLLLWTQLFNILKMARCNSQLNFLIVMYSESRESPSIRKFVQISNKKCKASPRWSNSDQIYFPTWKKQSLHTKYIKE